MLAVRSLRLAATRYTHPALCVWSSNVRTIPILEATTTTWCTRPLAAAYSKDTKPGVPFSSSCSFFTLRHFATSAPNTFESSSNVSTPPLNEKDIKTKNSPTPKPSDVSATNKSSPTSSPSSPVTKSSSTSSSNTATDKTDKCSTASLGDTGVKLPSKDQVESFFFKSLVYLWDFAYYVFCLSHKLVEKYVFNNSTVQYYWNQLLKRMDNARKEIKSK